MITLKEITKISDYEWEIPKTYRQNMRVPVRLFVTRQMLEDALKDRSIEQAVNAATLPGLVGWVFVMPDMHQGYGFPIGGVAATRLPDGVISPGGIGYDINCGVRVLGSQIDIDQVSDQIETLSNALNSHCPSGVGGKGALKLSNSDLEAICREGARWALKRGFANEIDIQRTEERGCLEEADPSKVSKRAKERGRPQIGSLGAGNHFIEVDVVDQIFDPQAAQVMGLRKGCLAVQIHCGSRGFGHQICTDYVDIFQKAVRRYGIHLPDRELVCAPLNSPEGQDYLAAMCCAANYAFTNRQILAHSVRRAFEDTLAGHVKNWQLHQIYDVAHNMGKIEQHEIDGKQIEVCVHRKGATRAFGPGSPELPSEYRHLGQPVLVPGSMGTSSWILLGTNASMTQSFGSCCHGAGRVMSRHQAKKSLRGDKLYQDLKANGIHIHAGSMAGLAEEAPQAYKNIDSVVESVVGANIARKVACLHPVAVIKG